MAGFGLVLVALFVRVLNLSGTGLDAPLAGTMVVAGALCSLLGCSGDRDQRSGQPRSNLGFSRVFTEGFLQPCAFHMPAGTRIEGDLGASAGPEHNSLIVQGLPVR